MQILPIRKAQTRTMVLVRLACKPTSIKRCQTSATPAVCMRYKARQLLVDPYSAEVGLGYRYAVKFV